MANFIFRITTVTILLSVTTCSLLAQKDSTRNFQTLFQQDLNKGRKFYALPTAYYTPETRWAIGVGAIGFFKADTSEEQRISSIRLSAAYTQNKQILFTLPWTVFSKENRYLFEGTFAFYRYPYFFTGLGYQPVENGHFERYNAQFPRFTSKALKRFGKNIYTGPQVYLQKTTILSVDSTGFLLNRDIPGNRGGLLSAFGWLAVYDSRDNVLAPQTGSYVLFDLLRSDRYFGSDFDYTKTSIDLRKYINLKGEQVLALQLYNQWISGRAPFNKLSLLGGNHQMRGYKQGLYRASHMSTAQVEYRSGYWGPLGFTAFSGVGAIYGPELNQAATALPTYGLGLRVRLNQKERIILRVDYGRGKSTDEFYFTVNEAF